MNLWPVEHFFPHFLTGLFCVHSKPVKKWGKKRSTGQRFICTKINFLQNPYFNNFGQKYMKSVLFEDSELMEACVILPFSF